MMITCNDDISYIIIYNNNYNYQFMIVCFPIRLPLHNNPFPGVLMKSIGAAFVDRMPFLT